jgi:hypothetical protein
MAATICDTFQQLADTTWELIESAHQLGMRWSEESNTESLLLELRRRHPSQIFIQAFTKRREVKLGADWEWWFLGRTRVYGMRVQAKRISLPRETFGKLRYTPKGHRKDQMTTLIERAQHDGLTPTYCFYVASQRYTRGATWLAAISPQPSQPSGCLIGHAQVVQNVGSSTLRQLASSLMPWHFLVCPFVGAGADLGASAAVAMQSLARGELVIAPPLLSITTEGEAAPYLAEPRTETPPHVRRLLEGRDGTVLDGVLKERGIRGLLVIRDAKATDSA